MHARNSLLVLALAGAVVLSGSGRAAGPKFFDDDPISRDPETQDASGVQPIEISQQFDYVENSFLNAGDRTPQRAVNVNTVDEVHEGRQIWKFRGLMLVLAVFLLLMFGAIVATLLGTYGAAEAAGVPAPWLSA